MQTHFTALTILVFSLLAAFTARAEGVIGRFDSLMVSHLTRFYLAPSIETFSTQDGQVAIDLARQTAKLSLDSQRGRFEVELPIVSRDQDECGVVTYRALEAKGFMSLEIRDRSRGTCQMGNSGIMRQALMQATLSMQAIAEDGVSVEKSVSRFEGTALQVSK